MFCGVLTIIYLSKVSRVPKRGQIAISVGAYVFWVLGLGGPFATIGGYQQVYGAALMTGYTFLVAAIEPK